jgi:iron complex outermembrane receptor protein
VYLATRRGYRSGGFDLQPASLALASFKPEFVNDVELGVKSEFNVGSMPTRLNAAAYFQKYKDIQRLIALLYNGAVTNHTANVARADIYGGEVELTMKPLEALELTATYAYVHPKNKVFQIPDLATGGTVDVSDSHFSYVATHQGSIGARYSLPVPSQLGTVSLSADWYAQSAMAAADVDTANCAGGTNLYCLNHGVQVPAYNIGNVRAEWNNVAGAGFDLSFFVTNVTDKVYKSSVLGLEGVLGFTSATYGPPRMYGVQVRIPFGANAY